MGRRTAFLALAVASAGPSFAQQALDPSTLQPITAPLIDAGTYNLSTHRWMSKSAADQLRAATISVYNNTCTWTGANFYNNLSGTCVTFFDEGRIPSTTSPNAPAGVHDDNLIDSFQIAYCSFAASGTVDIKIGF